jgi:ferredoxin
VSTIATVTAEQLSGLVAAQRAAGVTVIAPKRTVDGALDYAGIESFEEAVLGEGLPRMPLKQLFLPATEPLFSWTREGSTVELHEPTGDLPPRLVLGAVPCDAAALTIVDRVMDWDSRDELWFARRESTTVIGVACPGVDECCFCTAVGQAPDTASGSDLLLTPMEGGYLAQVSGEAGERLVEDYHRFFTVADRKVAPEPETPAPDGPGLASMAALREWLEGNFDDGIWQELALACHGCGACAAVCPTCHCFDIVDEPEGVTQGTRRRNWDTCQSSRFTVHASGHNPRADQAARLRQRVMHKFAIYPKRFDEILCSGCGRCVRGCPGGLHLPEILDLLGRRAAAGAAGCERAP